MSKGKKEINRETQGDNFAKKLAANTIAGMTEEVKKGILLLIIEHHSIHSNSFLRNEINIHLENAILGTFADVEAKAAKEAQALHEKNKIKNLELIFSL